jgi:putative addiction module killer protein
MEIKPREIRNYIDPDGRVPFREWFNSLQNKKVQTIVLNRLNRVSLGNLGDCKHLGEGIYELRIHYGPGYRVYFGDLEGVIVILLCGGTKRSQSRDIKRAKEYWLELRNRNYE